MMVAVIRDFTEALTQKRELQRLADTDYLTGVLNRRAFLRDAEAILSINDATTSSFSVAVFDIDDFKQINDIYGHAEGDAVLTTFANILCNQVRDNDILARWGGEEFIILMPQADLDEAKDVAERVCRRVREFSFGLGRRLSDPALNVTTSCGIASDMADPKRLPDLIKIADLALYKAKRSGKNCVGVLSASRRPEV